MDEIEGREASDSIVPPPPPPPPPQQQQQQVQPPPTPSQPPPPPLPRSSSPGPIPGRSNSGGRGSGSGSISVSTTSALTLKLQQALAKGDLGASLESLAGLLQLSGDNRLRHDLLLKLIDLTKHFSSLCVAAPTHTIPLLKCLRLLLVDKEPTLRSQSLRVLRYLLTDWDMLSHMLSINMDLLIVRSMERESKYLWERMQALKFIRKWMNMLSTAQTQQQQKGATTVKPAVIAAAAKSTAASPSSRATGDAVSTRGPISLTRSLVQSLVSIAEQPKDDFRRVCLDALRELSLLSPGLVASCNGVRTLVDSILDPACSDIAGSLTLTLLHLIDGEATRGFLRPSVDLCRLVSVFTDTSAADNPEREHRRAAAHKALVTLLRSWTGILVLTSDPACLRALLGMLVLPPSVKGSSWARETIFALLFEVIHVVKAADVRAEATRIRFNLSASSSNAMGTAGYASHAHPPNLLHAYMTMLLLSFLSCDLVSLLTSLALSPDTQFAGIASRLLGEILGLVCELFPPEVNRELNSLHQVVALAAGEEEKQSADHSRGRDDEESTTSCGRAVQVLQHLSHAELAVLGPWANSGYGTQQAILAHMAPGTGWGWTGPLGVNWDPAATTGAGAATTGQGAQLDWSTLPTRLAAASFSSSFTSRQERQNGLPDWNNSSSQNSELTPTGRRAVMHGIRLERLALRSELFPSARLAPPSAYGGASATNPEALHSATGALSAPALQSRHRMRHRLAMVSRSVMEISSRGGGVVQSFPPLTDYSLPESELAPLLKRSQVLSTKDFKQWDWDCILFIIERYMISSGYIGYLIVKTKFPKRLLSFLRSDKKSFVELEWSPFHLKFCRVSVALVRSLLSCTEGREYTWFNEFVDGIFIALLFEVASTEGRLQAQVGGNGWTSVEVINQNNKITPPQPTQQGGIVDSSFLAARRLSHLSSGLTKSKAKVFSCLSRSGITQKLGREYFTLLGVLSSSSAGLSFFEKHGLYDVLQPLARDQSKDYLTKLLIQNLCFFHNASSGVSSSSVGGGNSNKSIRRLIESWLSVPGGNNREGCSSFIRLTFIDTGLGYVRKLFSNSSSSSNGGEGSTVVSNPEYSSSQVTQLICASALNPPLPAAAPNNQQQEENPSWFLGQLLIQLGSLDYFVRSSTLDAIEEIVTFSPSLLHVLISRKPSILKDMATLVESGVPPPPGSPVVRMYPAAQRILGLFLGSKAGLEFLRLGSTGSGGKSWLDGQMESWRFTAGSSTNGGCERYVRGLEEALVSALSSPSEVPEQGAGGVQGGEGLSGASSSVAGAPKGGLDELAPPPPPAPISSAGMWNGPRQSRSVLDDALFTLVRGLPFHAELVAEVSGRSTQLMTQCWVVQVSHVPPSERIPSPGASGITRAPSGSEDMSAGGSFSASPSPSNVSQAAPLPPPVPAHGAPQTYLVCQVLDVEGYPRPHRVEGNTTYRVRITVGAGPNAQNVQDLTFSGTPSASTTGGTGAGAGAASPGTPSAARGASLAQSHGHGHSTSNVGLGGKASDSTSLFLEDSTPERDWSRIYFPDQTGHASEYVCRARDRERLSTENTTCSISNSSDICSEDEARWHFELPEVGAGSAGPTHMSARGPTTGSSPPGVTTLESIWFPLPMQSSAPASVYLLPHLYGELARTEEGCAVLAASGQVKELERVLREGDGLAGQAVLDDSTGFLSSLPPSAALEKRAALWALGHIGSTQPGFNLLSNQVPGLVQYLSAQSVSCSTLSMRGTCFYILGLLGRSPAGRASLSSLGWCFSPFPGGCIAIPSAAIRLGAGLALGIDSEVDAARRIAQEEEAEDDEVQPVTPPAASPTHRANLLTLPALPSASSAALAAPVAPLSDFLRLDWPASSYRGGWALDPSNVYGINSSKRTRKAGGVDGGGTDTTAATTSGAAAKDESLERLSAEEGIDVILSHLSNLCNHVTQKAALAALRAMKAQPHHAHFFTSPLLLFETFKLLSSYSYKLPARRFLFFDLFGGVAFNMHTVAQFDQPFQAQNVSSAEKQKLREAIEASKNAAIKFST